MEDTLRGLFVPLKTVSALCLNPCFNGRYSQSSVSLSNTQSAEGLNPCFNGRYSQSHIVNVKMNERAVLILVLMEDTLRVNFENDIINVVES